MENAKKHGLLQKQSCRTCGTYFCIFPCLFLCKLFPLQVEDNFCPVCNTYTVEQCVAAGHSRFQLALSLKGQFRIKTFKKARAKRPSQFYLKTTFRMQAYV